MVLTRALFFVAFALVVAEEEITKEEGVLVLTTANFKQAVANTEFILVEFYAPWCGHCKALKPEYEKAAQQLAEEGSSIALGKVDATIETSLGEEHGIRGYPTLKFFKNGTPMEYGGGRVADEIVAWLKKKTGPPAKQLDAVTDATEFTEASEVAVIGFFSDLESDAAKEFTKAAEGMDDIPFGITNADAVKSNYGVSKDMVVVVQKFDDGRADYTGELKSEEIAAFVKANSLPLVVEFSHTTAQKIFGGEVKSHVLIFVSKSDAKFQGYNEAATKVAKEFKGQILFVTINTDEEEHARILEFFGMTAEDTPTYRIIQLQEDMTKYKPTVPEITEDSLRNFVTDFFAGNLKQHLLTQDLPEDWNKTPVWTLTGSNFDEVAFDKTKDVLVEFYAPWCGHCKQLAPIYDQLGEKYADQDDIVIAKMDSTANELEHTKIQSFPTLKLYKKDGEVVDYSGARSLESLTVFVDTRGKKSEESTKEDNEEEEEDVHEKDEL